MKRRAIEDPQVAVGVEAEADGIDESRRKELQPGAVGLASQDGNTTAVRCDMRQYIRRVL